VDFRIETVPYLQALYSLQKSIKDTLLIEGQSALCEQYARAEDMIGDIENVCKTLVYHVQSFGESLSMDAFECVCEAGMGLVKLHQQVADIHGNTEIQQALRNLIARLLKQLLAWLDKLQQALEHPENHQHTNTEIFLELSAEEEMRALEKLLEPASKRRSTGLLLGTALGLGFLLGGGE